MNEHRRLIEPRCPKCDYLLFMLKSDRCPECGELLPKPPSFLEKT